MKTVTQQKTFFFLRYNISYQLRVSWSPFETLESLARVLRGQVLKGRLLNSTERRPSRCVRVEVHERAPRLKFLRLGRPCVARIRSLKHQPWPRPPNPRLALPETCRMRVWLGALEKHVVEGRKLKPVRYQRGCWACASSQVCGARATSRSMRASTSLPELEFVMVRNSRYLKCAERSRAPHAPHASTIRGIASLRCYLCAWTWTRLKSAVQETRFTFSCIW